MCSWAAEVLACPLEFLAPTSEYSLLLAAAELAYLAPCPRLCMALPLVNQLPNLPPSLMANRLRNGRPAPRLPERLAGSDAIIGSRC